MPIRPALFAICATALALCAPCAIAQPSDDGVIHQLRIYEIFQNNKQAFHDRFRDDAARIMAKYDFKIVAMWESRTPERTEFVYLLEWPDEATLKDRWSKFMQDQEWKDIKKRTGAQHGVMVGDIEDRTLRVTEYSPQKLFLPSENR